MTDSNNKKRKTKMWMIIGICVVVIAVALFFVLKDNSKNNFGKNFTGDGGMSGDFNDERTGGMPDGESMGGMQMQNLTDEEISEIENFFESSLSDSEIEDYCQENREYCMYYCMNINSESGYCSSVMQMGAGNRTPPEGINTK